MPRFGSATNPQKPCSEAGLRKSASNAPCPVCGSGSILWLSLLDDLEHGNRKNNRHPAARGPIRVRLGRAIAAIRPARPSPQKSQEGASGRSARRGFIGRKVVRGVPVAGPAPRGASEKARSEQSRNTPPVCSINSALVFQRWH